MQPDRDLDRELRDLGPRVEYPPVPDLARSVRSRLDAEAGGTGSPPRARPQLWWIAAAALVLLVAIPVFASVLDTTGSSLSGGTAAGGGGKGPEGGAAESRPQGADDANSSAVLKDEDETMEGSGGGDGANSALQAATTPNDEPVPNVVGAPVLEACRKLQKRDYDGSVLGAVRNERVAPGHVISQDPRVGRKGFEGQPVELVVSEPYPAEKLGHGSRCYDLTEYGPGGKPNVPD